MSRSISLTLQQLAKLLNATLLHPQEEVVITGIADIEDAQPGDLVFAETLPFLKRALQSPASAILTTSELAAQVTPIKPLLLGENPRLGFLKILESLASPPPFEAGIHPTAIIEEGAVLGEGVSIGPYAIIGAKTVLGAGVRVGAAAKIGPDCIIGDETLIYPNVVVYPSVKVGRRCILHAGCVLGADGFGYVPTPSGPHKVPHIGTVEIEDEVEIGANTCIDRARTAATRVGMGTKIDNLVHVGHNVQIGRFCLIAAQVGIAGSVQIGDGVVLAGQVGIADHIHIGSGARVGAQAGVIGDVAEGETVSGYPARPHRRKMREYAAISELPETLKRIRNLEKRLAELEAKQHEL